MVDDYVLDKVSDKIKKIIDIGKFDDTKIWIDIYDKMPDDVTLKNVLILMRSAIKDGNKFHSQLFLEEALYDELTWQ